MTLTVTYKIGNSFRRTVSVRCYVRGTVVNAAQKLFEIDLRGSSATISPALQFRDAREKVVGKTAFYWILDVEECAPDKASAAVNRAKMDLALGR